MGYQNRLANANSPYLRQHAGNPVDWYPWNEEALEKARTENRPLIISIGYAACHWCHVMAHESFMDQEIADFMNRHFVNIKVDREERPDIDQVYMDAVQHITGGGGWPLNAFALPDGRPFFGGTYFPRKQWLEMLKRIISVYENQYAELEEQADSLTTAIRADPLPVAMMENPSQQEGLHRYNDLIAGWDKLVDLSEGGFNSAPKFPMPVVWEFLLQYHHYTGHQNALKYVTATLDKMIRGGIYDQAGGGFARYSTDRIWKVPHFEKMLYDNAQLVSLYAHAFQVTGEPEYADTVHETIAFLERELKSPEGGFYSSLDADSEGEEGKFYTFTSAELKGILEPAAIPLLTLFFEVREEGNWQQSQNILHRMYSKREFAARNNTGIGDFESMLGRARQVLMEYRAKRIRPARDEKIITAWNALMIKAYADAFRSLGNEAWIHSAIGLASFLETKMISSEGHLFRSYLDGNAAIPAFLDDYALYAHAMVALYEVTFDKHWLDLSLMLTEKVLQNFSDPRHSLFFYSSDLNESLVARKHEIPDTVIPSSNSVMAHVLLKLGHLIEKEEYLALARKMLMETGGQLSANSPYFANYAMALGIMVHPLHEVAIVGEKSLAINAEMQRHFLPDCVFLGGNVENLPLLMGKKVKNSTQIYVCTDKICKLPVADIKTALSYLS